MKLTPRTTLVAILLISTVIGLLYWPLFPGVDLQLTPLFYTALGLTTLQAVVVIVGPIAAIVLAIFRLVRSERKADAPPVFASISAPIAMFLANPMRLFSREAKEDTSTDFVLAGYQAVRVLWWTYFAHLALGPILLIFNVIILTGQRSDWIFPPVFSLIVLLPPYAAFAAVLYMVRTRTYSNAYWDSMERSAEDRSAPLVVPRRLYIGAFVIGWLIVPIMAGFYQALTLDLG